MRLATGAELIDITDETVWAEHLATAEDDSVPESLRGIWFLKDNIAHENLVSFSDFTFVG